MTVHLSAHSYYSLLAALPSPAQLAQAAAARGQRALALTDIRRLSGAIEFYEACQEQGIQPLLGLQLDLATPQGPLPLTFLAMDMQGWGSLCRLSSALLNHPDGEERLLDVDTLTANQAGLLCLARVAGRQPLIKRLKQLFGDRLYLQLPRWDEARDPVLLLAKSQDISLVADWPIYYLEADHRDLQRLLVAIRLNTAIEQVLPEEQAPLDAYFPTDEEFRAAFSDFPETLKANEEVAARCRLELPLDQPHFPELDLPDGQQPIDELRRRAYAGAEQRYGDVDDDIRQRLEHELAGIGKSGYASLFLMMEEIISFARRTNVPTSSRGSASSSLVAHCLGITTPDPVRLNLYFERFLNPARKTPPDVDTDLCSRRRDIVINHIYEKYGAERVAMVATVNRFRRRSALREVAKAYGLSPEEIKPMADSLPYRYWVQPGRLPDKGEAPFARLAERYRGERHQRIFRDAEALIGMPHHLSIHPGGVVVTPGPLNDLAPTQYSTKGVITTQFDKDGVDRLGLVKMDMLGIRGLSVLGDVAEAVLQKRPEMGNNAIDVLNAIPDGDRATAEMVRTARTIGCFQIESPGMRATLKEVQAAKVDDVMVALALFRPGPLKGGLKDAFVRRHLGQEAVTHIHPALEPLLADTHGVILYQEQVLRIAHDLAGMSLADADMLRRAMSHFDPGERMRTLKQRFIQGAHAQSGVAPALGEHIWDLMAAFAGYGFPKAHSASYAQAAWRSAWCKTHYPAEFMAAVLANGGGYYHQETYIMEARRMGLSVNPPHINYSSPYFSVANVEGESQLYMGLDQVRDLTRATQERILKLRPFTSLEDFLTRAYPRQKEARNLIQVGALHNLGNIPELLARLKKGTWQRGQMSLFAAQADVEIEDWTLKQKAKAQKKLLGVRLVGHPLELYADKIAAEGVVSTVEAASRLGEKLRVAGIRQTWRSTPSSSGGYVYFMDLGDLEGTLRVIIKDDVYRRSRTAFEEDEPLLVEGHLEINADAVEPMLHASRIQRVSSLN